MHSHPFNCIVEHLTWECVQLASNNENVATLLFSVPVHWPTNNVLLVPLCSSLGRIWYIIMLNIF